jgi:hypothetical protein
MRLQATGQRLRQHRRQPGDHQREEDPDREHLRGVLERRVHTTPGTTIPRRQTVHHRRPVRRGETPIANPFNNRTAANAGYGKTIGSNSNNPNVAAATTIPAVANGHGPNRSDRYPDAGPASKNPTVNGNI